MSAQNDQSYPGYPQWFQYVVAQPEDVRWGLLVGAAGTSQVTPGGEYPARNHPDTHYFRWEDGRTFTEEYGIIYVTEGKGTFETSNCGLQQIEGGDVFILYPGIWHRYRPDLRTGWDEYWFNVRGPLAAQILAPPFFDAASPVLRVGLNSELLGLFLKVAELVKGLTPGLRPSLAATAMEVLASLHDLRTQEAGERSAAEQTAARARAYMVEHHMRDIDHRQLAGDLGVSYSTYRRIFKHYTGMSPNQYLIRIRLEHARDLLLHSNKSVYEVAMDTGFSSAEYLSRMFRQKFGQAPSDLRG